MAVRPSFAGLLQGTISALTSPNPNGFFHGQDEYFAVANPARAGSFENGVNDQPSLVVLD